MISPLLTDLYQFTMAYGYWKLGLHERPAVFHQIFRKQPFKSPYSVFCGLGVVIDFLKNWQFKEDDLAYLATLTTPNGLPLFEKAFLDYLKTLRFSCDVDAVLEGNIVFPNEPLIRIKGPLLQGQLIESTLLNTLNFQTLIATKASRVCLAAEGEPVLEFGLRRAQGPDGGLSASRAAYIGGCAATSNVLAGKCYGIPVSGTHAHSWVTAFQDELTAFEAYAKVMPNNCILLVDTYDTLSGVKNAIKIGQALKKSGGELRGIRLDSGDLAALSKAARILLDKAGFETTKIIASNSLDEYVIKALKQQGAAISIWGVGTNLSTAYDHPALDGVYKLSAIQDLKGQWQYKLKISEQPVKISHPGIHQIKRFYHKGRMVMDMIYDEEIGISSPISFASLDAPEQTLLCPEYDESVDLLHPIFREGKEVLREDISIVRDRAAKEVSRFLQHQNHSYSIGIEANLNQLKKTLMQKLKNKI